MTGDLVLRVIAKLLMPYMLLFALYVQFHGELGPGGAFQAGVILASAVILHMLVFGLETTRRVVPVAWLRAGAALGTLIYGGTGVAALLRGGTYLDYDALSADPVAGQHLGILLIEIGVGLTVASTMVLLVFTFAERTRR